MLSLITQRPPSTYRLDPLSVRLSFCLLLHFIFPVTHVHAYAEAGLCCLRRAVVRALPSDAPRGRDVEALPR